jgi:hypothetical protein
MEKKYKLIISRLLFIPIFLFSVVGGYVGGNNDDIVFGIGFFGIAVVLLIFRWILNAIWKI